MASSITPHKCTLKYHPYSYFSREPARKVTGTVFDASGKAKKVITGTWDDHLDIADVTKIKDAKKEDYETTPSRKLWKKVIILFLDFNNYMILVRASKRS